MNPGATTSPAASIVSPLGAEEESFGDSAGAIRAIRSPSIQMFRFASVPLAGSITRPFLMSSMGRSSRIFGFRAGRDHNKEHGHAHGEAVGNLLQNAGLRAIGNSRINFQPANHRAGMEHQGVRAGDLEPLRSKLIEQDILVER